VVREGEVTSDLLSTFPGVKAASDVELQPICFSIPKKTGGNLTCGPPTSTRSIQMTKNGLAASPSSCCHCNLGGIVVTTSQHRSNTAQMYHDTSQGVEEDALRLVGPCAR
jgi:hypothetical protein